MGYGQRHLLRLPRYAPERNSAENIREYPRENKLANTAFDSYGDIAGKACEAWLFFKRQNNRHHHHRP